MLGVSIGAYVLSSRLPCVLSAYQDLSTYQDQGLLEAEVERIKEAEYNNFSGLPTPRLWKKGEKKVKLKQEIAELHILSTRRTMTSRQFFC